MATLALDQARHGADAPQAGVIGPNAVTRLAEALRALEGEAACRRIFAEAEACRHLETSPSEMVDERDVARLHLALRSELEPDRASAVATEAGRLTARYLLDHRIPRAAQSLLRRLPRRLAARIMVAAVARHAWTFAGSGRFSYKAGAVLDLTLEGGPVASLIRADAPVCQYYAATFKGVFAAILGDRVRVTETACCAMGAPSCHFVLSWR